MQNNNRRENMRLVIEGNAIYEVDQDCMNRGLNQNRENRQGEAEPQQDRRRMRGGYQRP